MVSIRYSKRECRDSNKIEAFLRKAQTGFLGLTDGLQPYVVPLNYVWLDEAFYFHGAAEGRKVQLMDNNAEACLTVSEAYGTVSDPVPAKTDTAYMSVMAFGRLERVEDMDEAVRAMQAMLDKYVPGYYDKPMPRAHLEKYKSSLGSSTLVLKLKYSAMTAKDNEVEPDKLYNYDSSETKSKQAHI